eukprot:1135941-Karenia_brevis.AAC.1
MVPSLESSSDEEDEVEVSMPSERDLKRMRRIVDRRDRKSRRKQEPMMMMRTHECNRKYECDGGRVAREDRWVQVVGVDEEAKKMRLSFQ